MQGQITPEQIELAQLTAFLRTVAGFVKENYDPWESWHEDDIAAWFLRSARDNTIIMEITGGTINAIHEYWTITPQYERILRSLRGEDFPMPQNGDREGDIIFFPMAIYSKKAREKGLVHNVSRLVQSELQERFPEAPGYLRWVLKNQRARFVPFKKPSKETE
jgi:hypothetical protein